MKRSRLFLALASVLVVGFGVVITACSALSPEQREQIVKQTDEAKVRLDAAREELLRRQAAAIESNNVEEKANIEKTLREVEKARDLVAQGQTLLTATTNPDGSINFAGAGAAAMAINPLLGVGIMVGGPLLAGAIQQLRVNRRERQAAAIVKSIDEAREKSPEFDKAFVEATPVIAKVQKEVPGTQALVDRAQLD